MITVFLLNCSGPGSDNWRKIESEFKNPPNSAKPRVWWHWMNGNITREGIKADLEWMHRAGIGGFQNFDAGLTTPQIVDKRLIFMTPEWKDAFRLAARLADSLDLEMAIAGSPGWSESGGPWVKPEEAMKKFVWSETMVEGGKPFSGVLPNPPSTTGTFQNVGMERRARQGEEAPSIPEFYADAAVVAFRLPDNYKSLNELAPKVTSSGGKFSLSELTDGDLVRSALLPAAPAGKSSWIQFEFSGPQTIHAVTFASSGGGGGMFGQGRGAASGTRSLEVSDDGRTFTKVTDVIPGRVAQNTITFKPATGKFFRLTVLTPEPSPDRQNASAGTPGFGNANQQSAPAGIYVSELVLHTVGRVNRFEEKAGFAAVTARDLANSPTPAVQNSISGSSVIDLTSQMRKDGFLEWTPPDGKWIIMRLGYSLTGHQNSPASPEATGLEVDKLNPVFVRRYF
ncbi:MAG: discoidin domain-containing protein, partial [Bacteroidales bacterium]|nr:discoidin domain-containing protein [Bacteroidales bacterium]